MDKLDRLQVVDSETSPDNVGCLCITCNTVKARSEFYADKYSRNGLRSLCKSCQKKANSTPEALQQKQDRKKAQRKLDPRRDILYAAKGRAKKLGIPFCLTVEDIYIPKACPILGIPLEVGSGTFLDGSPSIDRIVPHLGYVKSNVTVISRRANSIKTDATLDELEAVTNYVRHHANIRNNNNVSVYVQLNNK